MNIPQNEQKHNSKHLSLQPIGNLAYTLGKSTTSYDSINSLTTHNTCYTSLIPSLMQEILNTTLHNSNSPKNNVLFLRNCSLNNTKSSSLDSSLSPRDILFFLQIVSLYQLELHKGKSSVVYSSLKLAKILGIDSSDNYSSICDSASFDSEYSSSSSPSLTTTQSRFSNTSSSSSAAGMRATILRMTSKLESLGLLKVFRRKRSNGMDKTNELIPVLPDSLYNNIKDSSANLNISDNSKLHNESNLDHILRTKLFVPIELEFMKNLFKDKMPSKYKLFFLNCIMSAYRNFRQTNSFDGCDSDSFDGECSFLNHQSSSLSFAATSLELMKHNNISRRSLFNIFKYIKQQDSNFFIKVEHKYTKSDDIDSNRYDKSIFVISINPLVFPISLISQKSQSQTEEITNYNCDELQEDISPIFPDTYEGLETGVQKKQPIRAKKAAHNNKEEIIKNKYSRNIDYIDENGETLENTAINNPPNIHNSTCLEILETLQKTKNTATDHKEEFFEDKQSLSSSKSYNNSSFLNDADSRNSGNISEEVERWQELRHFYPLSEKDVDMLNFRAGREFSNNFMNQLLLKLYIKYPEKRFKNKFIFLSYMAKILKNEKHQGPLVNHTSFRFSCNIGTPEKNLLEYEKYLNQIENSFDTSKEMQVKKKIAGRFSTELAYKILKEVELKTNNDNSFILALVPNQLALSERQIACLSEQLEAVYGINGYYVQEVEQEERIEDVKPERVGEAKGSIGQGKSKVVSTAILEKQYSKIKGPDIISSSKDIGSLESSKGFDTTNKNTVWHQIRKGLREELGAAVDEAWFAKAVAAHCNDTKTLTLTMPTRFMADWVKNNYSHVIRRLSEGCSVKRVEYSCD